MKRALCMVLCMAFLGGVVFTVGCVGGGTGGGSALAGAVFGALIIMAAASSGGASVAAFAANVKQKPHLAIVQMVDTQGKYEARIYINDDITPRKTVKGLLLSGATTVDGVTKYTEMQLPEKVSIEELSTGKVQYRIEFALANGAVIFKKYGNTEITNSTPIEKNESISTQDTAKAFMYDLWQYKKSGNFGEFAPTSTQIGNVETQVKAEMQAVAMGTGTYAKSLETANTEAATVSKPDSQMPQSSSSRFTMSATNVITDLQTGLKWKVSPGYMNWWSAERWAKEQGGRMPTRAELKNLNQLELKASGKYTSIDALFGERTFNAWSNELVEKQSTTDPNSKTYQAYLFAYDKGEEQLGDPGWDMHVTAFAVVP